MPIWKQRLFTRLHRPTDGEGNDLGGGAAAAIDSMSMEEGGAPAEGDQQQEEQPGADGEQDAGNDKQEPVHDPMARMNEMLDTLAGDTDPKKAEADAAKVEADAAEAAKAATPKTTEQEEAELLEGVKSDRGRERIQKVFAERKALEQDVTEFKQMVKSTGMSAQQFAQTMEFGRLMTSDDPQKLGVALEMIEQQRADLYARLGKEAPGVDLLTGHADLKQAVESMEITRERAVELAKFRKQDADQRQRNQVQQQTAQQGQQYQQTVQAAATQMDSYLQTRAKEVDHGARMKALSEHFRDPVKMQEFVSTFEPHQWSKAVQMMYDGVQVPRAPAANVQRPIRSRPAALGTPSATGATGTDRLMGHLDSLGI